MITARDLAQAVAAEHGYFGCTAEEADHALWNHSAFPICALSHALCQLDTYFAMRVGEAWPIQLQLPEARRSEPSVVDVIPRNSLL